MRILYQRYREVKLMLESKFNENEMEDQVMETESFLPKSPENRKRIHANSEPDDDDDQRSNKRSSSPTFQLYKNPEKKHSEYGNFKKTKFLIINLRLAILEFNKEYKSLKAEKRRLQIFLHEYQNDFTMKYGRKVQHKEDRYAVQDEYERYRQIKILLEKMEKETVMTRQ